MDLTTLGTLLAGVGAVLGAVVAFTGKRAENAITGYSSLTDDLQQERARALRQVRELEAKITERDARLADIASLRAADQAELARLRALVITLGGQP